MYTPYNNWSFVKEYPPRIVTLAPGVGHGVVCILSESSLLTVFTRDSERSLRQSSNFYSLIICSVENNGLKQYPSSALVARARRVTGPLT
jgi:hypothetical protein